MAKYTFEFKMKVVTEYLNQEGGVKYLACLLQHCIPYY